jgi:LPS export ABC transporter permease LptG
MGRIMPFPPSCNGFLRGFSPTILDRYLLGKILLPLLYCVVGFVSVWVVWDLSVNLPDFLSGHATAGLVARFYLLQLPSVLVLSIPVGLLLALLYSLTQLSRRNEIISMLCAGRSLYRIFLPILLLGVLLTAILTVFNYSLAPRAGLVREELKEEIKTGHKRDAGLSNHLFRNRENRRLWFLSRLSQEENNAFRVEIIQQDEAGTVTEKWYARSAVYIPATKVWILNDARHVTVDGEGNQLSTESQVRMEITGWSETPWKIASSQMNSDFLSLPELSDYLRYNSEFPKARLAPYVTHWHYRWALPWICLVVVFLGGPMGIVVGRRGIIGGVGAAIALFGALLFSSSLFLALGKGWRVWGWFAAWGPVLFFLGVGLYLFWIRASGREMPKFRLPGF